jgi:FlaG/FlaF family flagellin (archaellin)
VRAVLLIAIIVIAAVIAAVATGFININQTQPAEAPQVGAADNGVSAQGGRPPAFEVETGSIRVGSKETNVKIPTLEVSRPRNEPADAATTNNTM